MKSLIICVPNLNPLVYFHCYVMVKGMRRAWLFEVSESPSRGYWKQFLLSRLYEHSQYLPAVEEDYLPRGKVPPPLMYAFIKGNEKSLVV